MQLHRRRVLQIMGGAVAIPVTSTLGSHTAHAAAGLTLVSSGRGEATVVVADDADGQTRAAAAAFVEYVGKVSGASLPIKSMSAAPAGGGLVLIGATFPGDTMVAGKLSGLDGDGYVISQAGDGRLTIVGPTPWGTQFGVLEVLERFLGVAWLQAGPQGEDIPSRSTVTIPRTLLRQEPVWKSRLEYPDGNGYPLDETQLTRRWSAFNRLHYRVQVGQNGFQRIFPVSVYGDPSKPTYHPEIYPLHNGKRVLPTSDRDFQWQPDFSQKATADIAIAYALEQFARGSTSLSLSINDVAAFSENNLDFSEINLYGFASASEAYYSWVNKVAGAVAERFPDWRSRGYTIGVLAYKDTVNPPSFALHPMVVPFFTFDRYRWCLPADAKTDKDITARWLQRTERFGWYDWAYGNAYALPRVDVGTRGHAYRWAAQTGVRESFNEVGYAWGEGAKPWVLTKLWWDPARSAEDLTNEWCRRAAGKGAGDLVTWHQLWEHAWSKVPRTGTTTWYRVNAAGPAGGFTFPGYLQDISLDTVAEGRRLLDSAKAKAELPQQKARVELMRSAYRLYESTALSYNRSATIPDTADEAASLLRRVIGNLDISVAAAAERYALIPQFMSDPLLRPGRNPINQGLNWSGWMPNELWAIGAHLRNGSGGAVRKQIQALADTASSSNLRHWAAMALLLADGSTASLGENTGFETGALAPWQVSKGKISTGVVFPTTVSTTAAYEGRYGVRTTLVGGGIVQFMNAKPGFTRASIHFRTPKGQSAGSDQLVHTWFARDAQGRNLRMFRGMPVFIEDTAGEWAELSMQEFLPAGTARFDFYCSLFDITDGYSRGALEVDGAEFLQLADGAGTIPNW